MKITTDYAIRCVWYLAVVKRRSSSREIGETMSIPPKYAQQIMQKLRISGLVTSVKGGSGGYVLTKCSKDITMLQIVKVFQPQAQAISFVEEGSMPTECMLQKSSPANAFYARVQASIIKELTNTTVWDLLPDSKK